MNKCQKCGNEENVQAYFAEGSVLCFCDSCYETYKRENVNIDIWKTVPETTYEQTRNRGIKIAIVWFLAIFVLGITNTILYMSKIQLGAIPSAIFVGIVTAMAGFITKKLCQ